MKEGHHVVKPKGYPFPGQIRAVFTTSAGATRVVVESSTLPGLLHIYDPNQLAPCDHRHWSFRTHGRLCSCGLMMADFGD